MFIVSLGILILCFFLFDNLLVQVVPDRYRINKDNQRYHTEAFSIKMKEFIRLKDKLTLICIGDSRTRHGLNPYYFQSQQQVNTPTAYNFATASGGIPFANRFIQEYLISLPRLKTIIWGVSPRIFNKAWQDPIDQPFSTSTGYMRDQRLAAIGLSKSGIKAYAFEIFDRGLSLVSKTYALRSLIKPILLDKILPLENSSRLKSEEQPIIEEWGFMKFPQNRFINTANPDLAKKYMEQHSSGWFKLDEERFQLFENIILELENYHIDIIVFIPPMHYSLSQVATADHDRTPDDDYENIVIRLANLENKYSNYIFNDFNKDGNNEFLDEDWGDWNHLVHRGPEKLSIMIDEVIRSFYKKKQGKTD